MNYQQLIQSIITDLQNGSADVQTDNHGQVIIYSCLFQQADDSYEEYEDPDWEGLGKIIS